MNKITRDANKMKTKHVIMNFANPNAVDGEKPYRVHCNFVLYGHHKVLNLYTCPIVIKMQNNNIENRIINHTNNEVFVFQMPDSAKQFFDKIEFKKMCQVCTMNHKNR